MKFYSSEPNTLREELTRYQFFLQLKQDLLDGRLECPADKAAELCGLALQCKCFILFSIFRFVLFDNDDECDDSHCHMVTDRDANVGLLLFLNCMAGS